MVVLSTHDHQHPTLFIDKSRADSSQQALSRIEAKKENEWVENFFTTSPDIEATKAYKDIKLEPTTF